MFDRCSIDVRWPTPLEFPRVNFLPPRPPPGQFNPKGVLCLCFEAASPLWEALRTAANEEDVVVDIRTADGVHRTSLFCTFVVTNKEFKQNLTDHCNTWSKFMKSALRTYPRTWNEVLRCFPLRPVAKGKGSRVLRRGTGKGKGQPLATRAEALGQGMHIDGSLVKEFLRYFAYYHKQYRLAAPNFHKSIDRWHKSEEISENDEVYNTISGDDWFIRLQDMQQSAFGDANEVDWERWKGYKNSMLLPRIEKLKGKPNQELLFVREPTCVNFPAFVHLLGKKYTGAEILKAWKMMPIIKRSKPNGGRR